MNENDPSLESKIPRTDHNAKPIEWTKPSEGRRVIWVKNASYRNAVISGEFMVAEGSHVETVVDGKIIKIQVEATWYGWRPDHSWLHLSLTDECEELPNYTSTVISKIGRELK
jgi:hypothetical protein